MLLGGGGAAWVEFPRGALWGSVNTKMTDFWPRGALWRSVSPKIAWDPRGVLWKSANPKMADFWDPRGGGLR